MILPAIDPYLIELTAFTMLFLLTTAFLSGIADASTGGGGFLLAGAMLAVGVNPHIALGVDKFIVGFGCPYAAYKFYKTGLIKTEGIPKSAFAITFFSTMVGSICILYFSSGDILYTLAPITMFAVAGYKIYIMLQYRRALKSPEPIVPRKMNQTLNIYLLSIFLSFYDGFFGPGVITMWSILLSSLTGLSIMHAAGTTRVFTAISSTAAFLVFMTHGSVPLIPAVSMMVAYITGVELGVKFIVKLGPKFLNTSLIASLFIIAGAMVIQKCACLIMG